MWYFVSMLAAWLLPSIGFCWRDWKDSRNFPGYKFQTSLLVGAAWPVVVGVALVLWIGDYDGENDEWEGLP